MALVPQKKRRRVFAPRIPAFTRSRSRARDNTIASFAGWMGSIHRVPHGPWMDDGISVYCTKQYTRIRLDHYIRSQRVIDRLATGLERGARSGRGRDNRRRWCHGAIEYVGAADFKPNSPIRIKKMSGVHPSSRRFIYEVQKLPHRLGKRIQYVAALCPLHRKISGRHARVNLSKTFLSPNPNRIVNENTRLRSSF